MRCPAGAYRQRVKNTGFVLVTVLWALGLLSALSIAFTVAVRRDLQERAALIEQANAQLLADGLTRYFAAIVVHQPDTLKAFNWSEFTPNGFKCRSGPFIARIDIVNVGGLIDINAASRPTLVALLKGLGLPEDNGVKLAEAIIDFRDRDKTTLAGKPERDVYRTKDLLHGPKDGPFESITELDQVAGMTSDILAKLDHFVTIWSGQPFPDVSRAPISLLRALDPQGQSGDGTRNIAATRLRVATLFPQKVRTAGNAYRIATILYRVDGKRLASRRAVIQKKSDTQFGFRMLEWKIERGIRRMSNSDDQLIQCQEP